MLKKNPPKTASQIYKTPFAGLKKAFRYKKSAVSSDRNGGFAKQKADYKLHKPVIMP